MVTNLNDVNRKNVEIAVNTIYKVIDVIGAKTDGNAIAVISDLEKLKKSNSIIQDIVESKVKSFVTTKIAE